MDRVQKVQSQCAVWDVWDVYHYQQAAESSRRNTRFQPTFYLSSLQAWMSAMNVGKKANCAETRLSKTVSDYRANYTTIWYKPDCVN